MALAETELQDEAEVPLGRDEFVKRRQEQRSAAEDGRTAPPGDGDDVSPSQQKGEALKDLPREAPGDDPPFFDDDEITSGDEPTTLSVLDPPASMSDAEKRAFEQLPDDVKHYVVRVHETTARRARQTGESLAARNKEIENRVAQLDRSLMQAKTVLNAQIESLPYSQADLDRIAEDGGPDAWIKASAANDAAKAAAGKQQTEIDSKIQTRRKQILEKFNEDLTTLIPAWAKPEIRQKEATDLSKYLVSSGFSDAELKMVVDARMVMLARKAMRYDSALAKRREKSSTGKPTARPGLTSAPRSGSSTSSTLQAAEKRYRKNPSADNFAALRAIKREQAEANIRRRV